MDKLNITGLDTQFGYRTIELLNADLSDLPRQVDVLVASAFSGDFFPLQGTLLGSLYERHHIDCRELRKVPAIDLSDALGVWVSQQLDVGPAHRLLVLEMRGKAWKLEDIVDNLFAALAVMDAKRIAVKTVAMPLLGTGAQGLAAETVLSVLLSATKRYLEASACTSLVQFVEINADKTRLWSSAMDRVLGRADIGIAHAELARALRADIKSRLFQCRGLFSANGDLFEDWLQLMESDRIQAAYFGVQSRKLVERILSYLGAPKGDLPRRIFWVEQNKFAAPWICGYMTVLRHFGNVGAHDTQYGSSKTIPKISPGDLAAGMYCLERLLEFWMSVEAQRIADVASTGV